VLTLYLAALVFGLGLFIVQLFASGAADADGEAMLPEAMLPEADADLALGGGAAGGGGVHGQLEPSDLVAQGHGRPGWASIFLSLRFYLFAAIAFGAVGAPVAAFDLSSPGLTLGVALLTGFVVGALASLGFRLLGRETLSSGATAEELLGHVGLVLIACEKGRRGKVRLTVRGQTLDVLATTDEARIEPGMGVIVQEVHAERVHVCAAPSELLPVVPVPLCSGDE
jgi:hypothetical protein